MVIIKMMDTLTGKVDRRYEIDVWADFMPLANFYLVFAKYLIVTRNTTIEQAAEWFVSYINATCSRVYAEFEIVSNPTIK